MGHYDGGMLDIYSDLTQQCPYFGGPIEMMEVDELSSLRRGLQPAAVAQRIREFQKSFDIQSDCSPQELERAASTSPGAALRDRSCTHCHQTEETGGTARKGWCTNLLKCRVQ